MKIIIIRHGESVNNQPDRSLHTTDPDLTPRGLAQAQLLGERFADIELDALFASPLSRALRTANEISRRKNNMPVGVRHDMVENGTDYLPMTHAEALKICPAVLPYEPAAAAGNFGDNFELSIHDPYYNLSRAYRVVSFLRQSFGPDAVVAVVAHGAFNQSLIAAALRLAFPADYVYSQENTGVSVVSYTPNAEGRIVTRLVMMNDTSHLYRKGLTD